MSFAKRLTAIIDWFYIKPLHAILPLQTYRYAVCGGGNMVLSWVLFFVFYNFVVGKEIIHLPFIAISPYVATFIITFPITFFTGFWLQKNITFQFSPLRSTTQLFRYLLSVAGSIVLNYIGLKFFVEVMNIYPTPSQMITSLITIVYSYLMQKYFSFRGSVSE